MLTVRLKKDVRDMAGNRYAEDSLQKVVFAPDGIPEVVGAGYLPLSRDEWEPALSDGDLDRLLSAGGETEGGKEADEIS